MRPTKLSVVRNERKHSAAKELRRDLYARLGDCIRDAGDDVCGYAIVLWDKNGHNWSTLKGGGPIRTRLAPSFVSDALNQHVAVDLTRDELERNK